MLKVTISDRNDNDNNRNDYSDDSEKSNNNNNNNNNQTFINRLIVIESSKSNRFNPNHLKRLWKVWTNLINSQYIQSLSLIIYQMLS